MEQLLTAHEVAAVLRISPSTPYTWAARRRISAVKIGRALRFRQSDIAQLIEKGSRPSEPATSQREHR